VLHRAKNKQKRRTEGRRELFQVFGRKWVLKEDESHPPGAVKGGTKQKNEVWTGPLKEGEEKISRWEAKPRNEREKKTLRHRQRKAALLSVQIS